MDKKIKCIGYIFGKFDIIGKWKNEMETDRNAE